MESSAAVLMSKRSSFYTSSVVNVSSSQRSAPIGHSAPAAITRASQIQARRLNIVKGNPLRREFLPLNQPSNLASRESCFFGQGGARWLAGASGASRTLISVRSQIVGSSFKTEPAASDSATGEHAGGVPEGENGTLANSSDMEALRAALQAAEQKAKNAATAKEKALQALHDAEKRIEEYAANMIATAEEAMKEVEGAKETFRAELERVSQEKREVEAKLAEAQSDAVQLAVRVEEMAVSAIKERSEASAEDASYRIAQAQAMAADAKVAVEQRIRKAADEAAAAVINEARATIEDALAAASLAQQQARTAEAALKDNMGVLDKLAQAEADASRSEQARARLESELSVVQMEVQRLRDEVIQAESRAKSAEARIAAAEKAVAEIQRKSEEVAGRREKELEGALESFKLAAQAKEDAVRISYENENEKLRKATEAAQNAAKMKETSWERRYRALEQALRASEQQVDAWRARAVAVEDLMKQVKTKGFDVLREAGEARDLFNGGRMSNMLLSDSQRWELLANGPRRDSPFNVPKYGLPPRSSQPAIEDVPVELPSPDSVWSIADFIIPTPTPVKPVKPEEKEQLTREVTDRVAIEKERQRLERRMARIKREKAGESDVGTDDTWESGTGSGEEIVFQGFHWESHRHPWYQELAAKAGDLAECGFTTVWLPPPTESVAPQGYMPVDFYNLSSAYGSVDKLKACIAALHDKNIQVLGDVVLNHRCASKQSPDGTWNIFGGQLAWGPNAIVRDDPNFKGQGNPSSGDFFHAAPNIDHSQEFVRHDIKAWLEWLRKDIGYDGWRLDFVRGFWGGWVKEYIESSKPSFAIGEYWDSLAYENGQVCYNQDAHRQRIINWINATGGTASAFDVTTKGILHSALHNEYWRLIDPQGKPPGVMGWWPSRAVTFLENHDTGSTQAHWPFPRDKLLQGYAYILTHPGTPTVFYDHLYDFGMHDQIADLIKARIRAGIQCRSPIRIMHATMEGYAAVIDKKLCMKIGHLDWSPAKENNLEGRWGRTLDRGTDYQIWEKE